MICAQGFPFIQKFLEELNVELLRINPKKGLSWAQKKWIAFCIVGILVTGTFCWSQFERYSLGKYSVATLSWVFRKAKIFWEKLLYASVQVILKKYSISSGHLIVDDTDRSRSKSTVKIGKVHKIYDKKTSGYFMGQNIVFLLLVTDKITIPVGFKFYEPDPKKTLWNKKDQEYRTAKIPKSKRPSPPANDPQFPTKIELGLQLLTEFKESFPNIQINSISVDAAYGSSDFFQQSAQIYQKTQVISQIRCSQKVFYKGQWIPVEKVFSTLGCVEKTLYLRGKPKKVTFSPARLLVHAHNQKRLIVALKYEGEKEFRYLIASHLSWRAEDVIIGYSNRWLVEVFNQDWKSYEGWGQLALQQGVEGAFRGVLLSLLVDLCLLYHPNQFAQIKNKQPACTVGSLREQLKNESLLMCFHEVLLSESPLQAFTKLKEKFSEFFVTRDSTKHMGDHESPDLKPSPSLTKKFGKLNLCYI